MSHADARIASWKTNVWQNQAIAQQYQRNIYADHFFVTLKNLRETALACEHAKGRVLDAGAGTGRFTIPLYDAGFDVTGMDISQEMLDVARRAAGSRPIPLLQGSVFEIPFPERSFDSVVSITVVPHFPQWQAVLREYVRVLRPGGKLVFNMCSQPHVDWLNRNGPIYGNAAHPEEAAHFQVETTGEEVGAFLQELDVTLTHVLPSDTFNANQVLKHGLGDRYDAVFAALEAAFASPNALDLWQYVESTLFPYFPVQATYGFLVVAQLPGDGEKPVVWQAPRPLDLAGRPLGAETLRPVMGAAYEPFVRGLEERLGDEAALRALAALSDLLEPVLPIAVDWLSMLSVPTRGRLLNQIAWRWARSWDQSLVGEAHEFQGAKLAPMLSYEVFRQFAGALKPLVQEA